jgi:hypothetical protein
MSSCKRCQFPPLTVNVRSFFALPRPTTTSNRQAAVMCSAWNTPTNPALDAGRRPAAEAWADFKPPAISAAFYLRPEMTLRAGEAWNEPARASLFSLQLFLLLIFALLQKARIKFSPIFDLCLIVLRPLDSGSRWPFV